MGEAEKIYSKKLSKPIDRRREHCYNNKAPYGKPHDKATTKYADMAELADALDSGSSRG
jgi:hypothetical protein